MPINEIPRRTEHQYRLPQPFAAYAGFDAVFKGHFKQDTDNPCIMLDPIVCYFSVENMGPGWEIVSGPSSWYERVECDKADCRSSKGNPNKMDGVHCQGNVTMALKTPGIPTPWGSIGSITLTTVQYQMDVWMCADSSLHSENNPK